MFYFTFKPPPPVIPCKIRYLKYYKTMNPYPSPGSLWTHVQGRNNQHTVTRPMQRRNSISTKWTFTPLLNRNKCLLRWCIIEHLNNISNLPNYVRLVYRVVNRESFPLGNNNNRDNNHVNVSVKINTLQT